MQLAIGTAPDAKCFCNHRLFGTRGLALLVARYGCQFGFHQSLPIEENGDDMRHQCRDQRDG